MRKAPARQFAVGILTAFLLATPAANATACTDGATGCEAVPEISLQSLLANGDARLGQTVYVVGILENIGRNFFTDLRVVLKDRKSEDAAFVYVRPWLPLELPPGPRGGQKERPLTLSNYLGKKVQLKAVLSRGMLRNVGEVNLLEVKAAKILE